MTGVEIVVLRQTSNVDTDWVLDNWPVDEINTVSEVSTAEKVVVTIVIEP